MPTMPKQANSLNTMKSADIVDAVWNEADSNYQSRVPKLIREGDELPNGRIATAQDSIMSLRGIGSVLYDYQPLRNAFLEAIVNRIGRVIITSRLYENPWAGFKKGMLEFGETVEEIFVSIATPYQFDPELAEQEVFKRRIPDVKAAFHSMNFQKYYPTTVSNDQLRQAFLSWQGITDLIGRIIEQVYTGANYDEFLVMKYLIARMALEGNIYPVNVPAVNKANASEVTSTMVNQALDLQYMSPKYNMAGVTTYTDVRYLYTILTNKVASIFNVEVLALAFNMDKAELLGRQIGVESFGEIDAARLAKIFADDPYTDYVPFTEDELAALSNIVALMVDESWFMIFDNYYNMTDIYNPQGLYWNYFYHVWKIFSISPFSNAVLFTSDTPAVTSVTLSPATATVNKSQSIQLTPTVATTGFAPKSVNWAITGQTSAGTVINEQGLLKIGSDETGTTINVEAVSTYDTTKKGTAVITVAS